MQLTVRIVSCLILLQGLFAQTSGQPVEALESRPAAAGHVRGQTARHARVAKRREGVLVICHRGALEFAHENTLEAYRATLELGADGNEIDIRCTYDGVLVCFHDDMLDMILDAYGDVADHSWAELQRFSFRRPGAFGKHCRIPTLREVFELHRRHSGLLHLDVKRPGLDRVISTLLTELDMWDHVMAVGANCEAIISDPRYRPVPYKASLYLDRTEVDAAAIAVKLKRSGGALMVEDPRGLLIALGRKIGQPSSNPVALQPVEEKPVSAESTQTVDELLAILDQDADWNQVAETEGDQIESASRILARARAADELARRSARSKDVINTLMQRVRNRSLQKDWRHHGLDGASALRALIRIQAPEAIELARFCLWRDDRTLEAVRNPQYDTPRSWVDFRVKMIPFHELQSLPGAATEKLARDYLALEESSAYALGPLQYEAAARTLLTISAKRETALELLDHPRSEVRGRTVLFCVARAKEDWAREVLKEKAPHALSYVLASARAIDGPLVSGGEWELGDGTAVATWYPGLPSQPLDLLIHFHGDGRIVTERFAASSLDAVLVAVNFNGLSAAYAEPFRDSPDLFEQILNRTMLQLCRSGRANLHTQWRRVCISSFSAGYGSVREILKSPEYFQTIDGVLAADSIYAGLHNDDSDRIVNEQQMLDFRRFSQLASERNKTFIVTHSYIETPYASTRETADYLLQAIGVPRVACDRWDSESLRLVSRASKGNFVVLGYEGRTGKAHMQHLRHINLWWPLLPLHPRP